MARPGEPIPSVKTKPATVLKGMSGRRAPLKVDVIIVGGSIAGLAAAFTIARAGHRVRVLEKSSGDERRSASIRILPNMSTVLSRWGLDDELAKLRSCRVTSFQSLATDEAVGVVAWHEEIIKETGGEFYSMHYADFSRILYDLAISEGAEISYNQTVTGVGVRSAAPHPPYVVLESGQRLTADLIVGADGDGSIVREYVEQMEDGGIPLEHCMYSTTISRKEIETTPLASWIDADSWPLWMGNRKAVTGCPIRNNTEYAMHIMWPDDAVDTTSGDRQWSALVPSSALRFDGPESQSPVAKLVHAASDYICTRYKERAPLDSWTDETGQVVLIGAAAHTEIPFMIQNNSIAIEDAEVLGTLLTKISARSQIPLLTEAFQDLREDRCAAVIASDKNNSMLLSMPPGPERDGRDAGMRMSLAALEGTAPELTDEELAVQWDNIGSVLAYNATDAAEDWWLKWGSLSSSDNNESGFVGSPTNPFRMEITSQARQEVEHKKSSSSGGSTGSGELGYV